jgi:hypothetical protein
MALLAFIGGHDDDARPIGGGVTGGVTAYPVIVSGTRTIWHLKHTGSSQVRF